MKQMTMRIPIENRRVYEVNKIVQAVLLRYRFIRVMKNGKFFWSYGNPNFEIIPCISSEIENRTLLLQGWLYDKDADENGSSMPDFMLRIPMLRVKKIMCLIAYIVRYGKTRKA